MGYYVRDLTIRNLVVPEEEPEEELKEEPEESHEDHSDDTCSKGSAEDATISEDDMRYVDEALAKSPFIYPGEGAGVSSDIQLANEEAMLSLLLTCYLTSITWTSTSTTRCHTHSALLIGSLMVIHLAVENSPPTIRVSSDFSFPLI